MSKVKIETFTAVHIGNGNLLQKDMDYVIYEDEDKDSYIGIINPRKILPLIGVEHLNDWLLAIERKEDIRKFVARFNKKATIDDYIFRSITDYTGGKSLGTLKECLHNGMGVPYIPGSSIKGAIRTAVLATIAQGKRASLEHWMFNLKGKLSAKKVESELFGPTANEDVFRFFQVGDAYFEKGCEVAYRMVNLNIRKTDSLKDGSKPQAVEAISCEFESEFDMRISKAAYGYAKTHGSKLKDLPAGMDSLSSLFDLVNEHTYGLVRKEITYWTEVDEQKSGAEDYLSNMKQILDEVEKCKQGKECILRLGHGSGWRFITGAWAEMFRTEDWKDDSNNMYHKVVWASRPKAYQYQEYDFPKSRRLDYEGCLLGFVKLSLK
ncbi:MAG TPA: type III-A CRISPR-associated RAMP protein Csm5 [Parabacteroides sp.]|nr:type III-A CRISPR-associated RAMP protein Csm5 [Parabacteroides sp.]